MTSEPKPIERAESLQAHGNWSAPEPVISLDAALVNSWNLLATNPSLSKAQIARIFEVAPTHPIARLIDAAARRRLGDAQGALSVLEPLAREQPTAPSVHFELGCACAAAGQGRTALLAFQRVVQLRPDLPEAWRLLADHLDAAGETAAAQNARANFIRTANRDPRLMAAAKALLANDLAAAETLLREHLSKNDTDVAALRMLGEIAARLRRYGDAEELLERCINLAPDFSAARYNYAVVLSRRAKYAMALHEIEKLLAEEPWNPSYRNLAAGVNASLGDYDRALGAYEALLQEHPSQSRVWLSFGHALKSAGHRRRSEGAYRKAIALEPTLGEAYWSLANLKTFRFEEADIGCMNEAVNAVGLPEDDQLHFNFALGKALEDRGEFASSFAHYSAGAAMRRKVHPYSARATGEHVRRSRALYTAPFMQARRGQGNQAADPVFIVGLPRAGSTLVEQILASHSSVEGTMELPDIPSIVTDLLGDESTTGTSAYPECLALLKAEEIRALGERYLSQTRIQRRTQKPYFIDKMPNNWLHVGLIHLILPNARIIDVRRHPLACGLSCFKQHFARGQNFTYDLADIGLYYRDYVELLAHMESVAPGCVYRVVYERLIRDTETEVRRLLRHCGLPFEEQCLRFYETQRPVRTASAEQVRQPIYSGGVEHWRNFQEWLSPLEQALGSVLARYPEVPPLASFDVEDGGDDISKEQYGGTPDVQ